MTVVDGPGIGDTRLTGEDNIQACIKSVEQIMSAAPGGYHALLLTFRYGTRFTEEDRSVLNLLKRLLGSDFVRKNAVLVVTCGDVLTQEMTATGNEDPASPSHFTRWIADQTGALSDLIKEIEGRVVLFNNVTKDANVLDAQTAELLKAIDDLKNRGLRYTEQDFLACAFARQTALIETRHEKIHAETKVQLDAISARLAGTMARPQNSISDLSSQISSIEQIQREAEDVRQRVDKEDQATGALKSVQDMVQAQKKTLENAFHGVKALLEQKKSEERRLEEMRRAQAEVQRQQEEQRRQAELRRQEEIKKAEQIRKQQEEESRRREAEAKQRELELQRQLAEEQEKRKKLEAEEAAKRAAEAARAAQEAQLQMIRMQQQAIMRSMFR